MTDLIIICENVDKKSEDLLMTVIKNLDKHNFKNKYLLFFSANFAIVLNELNLLNKNKLKKEYDFLNINLKQHVENVLRNFKNYQKDKNYISHKKYLNLIKFS